MNNMNNIQSKHLKSINRHIYLFRAVAITLNEAIINQRAKLPCIGRGQLAEHDLSKFVENEFLPYSLYLWKNEEQYKEGFLAAVQSHYDINRHHPEYWIDWGAMPDEYLVEMWADWMASSYQYTKSWNMVDFLNKNLGAGKRFAIMFNDKQRGTISKLASLTGYWENHNTSPVFDLFNVSSDSKLLKPEV